MVAELMSGLGIFNSLLDIAKGLKDISDGTVRNAAAIELQEKILAAHQAHSSLLQSVRNLEEEVAGLKAWNADKQRYELKELAPGQFAYALKEDASAGEPAHTLCANCYSRHQKSILQREIRFPGRHTVILCHNCGSELFASGTGGRGPDHPAPESAVTRRPRR